MEGGGLDPEPSRCSSSDSLEPESDGRVPDSDGRDPAGPVIIVWIYIHSRHGVRAKGDQVRILGMEQLRTVHTEVHIKQSYTTTLC